MAPSSRRSPIEDRCAGGSRRDRPAVAHLRQVDRRRSASAGGRDGAAARRIRPTYAPSWTRRVPSTRRSEELRELRSAPSVIRTPDLLIRSPETRATATETHRQLPRISRGGRCALGCCRRGLAAVHGKNTDSRRGGRNRRVLARIRRSEEGGLLVYGLTTNTVTARAKPFRATGSSFSNRCTPPLSPINPTVRWSARI